MTALDWALAVVWLGIALCGFWKGAARLVLGIGGLVAGLWLAVAVGVDAAALLQGWLGPGWIAAALGRVLPAVACIALCLAAGWGISRTLEAVHLGWLNRLAGALLAGGVGLIVLAVLLGAAARTSPSLRELSGRSLLAPRLLAVWGQSADAQAEAAGVNEAPQAGTNGSSGR
ncbi:MAG TPA: CvpA family protein [Thermoanaerobaculales bacterium]|nr:CvpA family protein [Thermoanaerobaculales bacterium]HPA81056.1 CvpA family protein [Thermoanaerobaculales bacterium]HQL30668.1 CvpA family protein [Thermoanaerobaculales bacterium]HQN95678.1 CvpA family protein [Thermoanaerobaculales bacterium]HQP43392.1 CvpA family protein [Thermoanaerobaculales bacterium]